MPSFNCRWYRHLRLDEPIKSALILHKLSNKSLARRARGMGSLWGAGRKYEDFGCWGLPKSVYFSGGILKWSVATFVWIRLWCRTWEERKKEISAIYLQTTRYTLSEKRSLIKMHISLIPWYFLRFQLGFSLFQVKWRACWGHFLLKLGQTHYHTWGMTRCYPSKCT